MAEHKLKTWPPFFEAVVQCRKKFEVRRMDRPFCVGDTLTLQEWNPTTREYSGRESRWLVGYMMTGPQFGVEAGYTVMSLVMSLPPTGQHTENCCSKDGYPECDCAASFSLNGGAK